MASEEEFTPKTPQQKEVHKRFTDVQDDLVASKQYIAPYFFAHIDALITASHEDFKENPDLRGGKGHQKVSKILVNLVRNAADPFFSPYTLIKSVRDFRETFLPKEEGKDSVLGKYIENFASDVDLIGRLKELNVNKNLEKLFDGAKPDQPSRPPIMAAFEALFGKQLISKDGSTVNTSDALAGKKHVMIYFSAHW
jgi:hypothetical protein